MPAPTEGTENGEIHHDYTPKLFDLSFTMMLVFLAVQSTEEHQISVVFRRMGLFIPFDWTPSLFWNHE
eukprot:m.326491 g.326491  ORF g.326491 m.326491 type:complete len:68 (+) comp20406_c0_seq4:773-976(+)